MGQISLETNIVFFSLFSSAPALRREVCEKAMEIWNNYRSSFPDQRFLLTPYSSDEELEVLQRALDGDVAAQNDVSRLFESMGNQEASNYWLKEAMAMNEEDSTALKNDTPPISNNISNLHTIMEETEEDVEIDPYYGGQDSNTETETGAQRLEVISEKKVPATPVNSDAEPEPVVLSEPQDTTLTLEEADAIKATFPDILDVPAPLPFAGQEQEQPLLPIDNADEIVLETQPDLVEFFRPDTTVAAESPSLPLENSHSFQDGPQKLSREAIKGLEMKAEWDEAYRLLKAESPMIISTRTSITPTEASSSVAFHSPVEESIQGGFEEEEFEEEVFYEAQEDIVEVADIAYDEDDLIKFLDVQEAKTTSSPSPLVQEHEQEEDEISAQSFNDISTASVDAAVRHLKASNENLGQENDDEASKQSIDRLSPEFVRQLENDAEKQAAAKLAAASISSMTASSPAPTPGPGTTLKLSPEDLEKIQREAASEEAARLHAIDAAAAVPVTDHIVASTNDVVRVTPSPRSPRGIVLMQCATLPNNSLNNCRGRV